MRPRSRLRGLGVGPAGGCGAAFVALLRATETGALPTRTRIVIAAPIVVGPASAAFGTWALTARRPLYGHDRVVGGWIALAATTAVAASAGPLYRARAHRRTLLRRRRELREGTG
ncbi:hypothetical protein [Embleya scabrispora]|uniref:hypothetical protein n=1 Tax=Embleya scabrispora TaxID=159449 RepID=UPI001F466B74|nr:hypothetical protein [Embleya scabrispora]